MTNTIKKEKATTMEINKLSTSIISILVTLAITLGSFSYKTGTYSNEMKNLKEDINILREVKAEKVVVEMIMESIKESGKANTEQHTKIMSKLDKLIEKNLGEK